MKLPGQIQVLFAPEGESGSAVGGNTSAPNPSSSAGSAGGSSSGPSGATPSAPSPGGGATTPSPSPEGREGAEPSSDIWGFDDFDSDLSTVEVGPQGPTTGAPGTPAAEQPKAAPPVAAQPAPAEVQPTGAKPPEPAQVAPPGPQAGTQVPKDGTAEGRPPLLTPAEPAELAKHLAANAAAIEEQVALQHFALSNEDLEALDADAGKYIPRLLARGFIRSQVNALNFIAEAVPKMIQHHLAVQVRNSRNEDSFYKAWPQLDKAKHSELVTKTAHLYRQMNPSASMDDLVKAVGAIVMHQAGIPFSPLAPAHGVTAAGGNGVRPPPSSPFVPAVGGPMGGLPQPSDDNPWGIDPNAME